MRDDDFVFGCRSAIQKAIRRGDLNLAKTAFDALWADKTHRNWLKWRLPILVVEEALHLTGELAEFLTEHGTDNNEKAWKKFIYTVTISLKSKDAVGIRFFALNPDKIQYMTEELKVVTSWINPDTPALDQAVALFDACMKMRKLTQYEVRAINCLKERIFKGGMEGDKSFCLAGMILITLRGLDADEVKKQVAHDVKVYKEKNGAIPKTINLPWYVFDKHTQLGKMAFRIFMKRKAAQAGIPDEDVLWRLWFFSESAKTPAYLLKIQDFDAVEEGRATVFDSIYWIPELNEQLPFDNYTPKQAKRIWDEEIAKEISNIINWCIEKRAEK